MCAEAVPVVIGVMSSQVCRPSPGSLACGTQHPNCRGPPLPCYRERSAVGYRVPAGFLQDLTPHWSAVVRTHIVVTITPLAHLKHEDTVYPVGNRVLPLKCPRLAHTHTQNTEAEALCIGPHPQAAPKVSPACPPSQHCPTVLTESCLGRQGWVSELRGDSVTARVMQ